MIGIALLFVVLFQVLRWSRKEPRKTFSGCKRKVSYLFVYFSMLFRCCFHTLFIFFIIHVDYLFYYRRNFLNERCLTQLFYRTPSIIFIDRIDEQFPESVSNGNEGSAFDVRLSVTMTEMMESIQVGFYFLPFTLIHSTRNVRP